MARYIGDIHQHFVFGYSEIIQEIPAEKQRGLDEVIDGKPGKYLFPVWQHPELDLTAGALVST